MKAFALAASLSLFMSVGNATAQMHHWPATDQDPYFKTRHVQRQAPRNPPRDRLPTWTDTTDRYGGYPPNSPEGVRAYWDYMSGYAG
jgi:hypothetical protein